MHGEKFINKAVDILKGLMFLVLTALFGVCSYVVTHLGGNINQTQFIMSGAGFLILLVFLCLNVRYLYRMMNALDELEKQEKK